MSRRDASVYVGRLNKNTRTRDLEDIFEPYGKLLRCDIKYGSEMAFAFIDFEDRRDAEDCVKYEHGRELNGQSIIVEWAKGGKDRRMMQTRRPDSGSQSYDECFRCRRTGHWARDCPDVGWGGRRGGGGGGGRGGGGGGRRQWRSPSPRQRSRSRDRKRRTRSPSNDRRKRSRSRDRKRSRSQSGGRKSSRSRSGSGKSRSGSEDRKKGSRSKSGSRDIKKGSTSRSRSKSPRHSNSKSHSKSPRQQLDNHTQPPTVGNDAADKRNDEGGDDFPDDENDERRSRSGSKD